MSNESVKVFKPEDITVTLDGKDYRLVYDLNAFAELEKIYDSVDSILQMLLGTTHSPDLDSVTYMGSPVKATDIMVAGFPLAAYIEKINSAKKAKHTDTLNLLWAGCLHDCAIYNNFGEITGYTITKSKLGAAVTFKNLRDVNAKIVVAILRDLLPSDEEKNAEEPEGVDKESKSVPAPAQRLTLSK